MQSKERFDICMETLREIGFTESEALQVLDWLVNTVEKRRAAMKGDMVLTTTA